MFPEFFRRLATHDKSASRIDLGPPKTLTGALFSNDDANWWMIKLSDLTLLLLGFLVAWYVIDKKDLTATTAARGKLRNGTGTETIRRAKSEQPDSR